MSDHAADIYALADRCGVGIGEACDLACVSRSTPPRWRNGHKPRARQFAAVRRAILELAEKRGTLPADLVVPTPSALDLALRIAADAQALATQLSGGERDA